MLKSYQVQIEGNRIQWLGEKPKTEVIPGIIVIPEERAEIPQPKPTTPTHLRGKGRTLGDIVSPIVDEEDWECL